MRRQEQVLAVGEPSNVGYRRCIDHSVLVDARILLRHGLVPDDVAGREAHDDVQVVWAFCDLIDIVSKRVRFGEQNLGQVLFLGRRRQI